MLLKLLKAYDDGIAVIGPKPTEMIAQHPLGMMNHEASRDNDDATGILLGSTSRFGVY